MVGKVWEQYQENMEIRPDRMKNAPAGGRPPKHFYLIHDGKEREKPSLYPELVPQAGEERGDPVPVDMYRVPDQGPAMV